MVTETFTNKNEIKNPSPHILVLTIMEDCCSTANTIN